jgi:hypothetical protein
MQLSASVVFLSTFEDYPTILQHYDLEHYDRNPTLASYGTRNE